MPIAMLAPRRIARMEFSVLTIRVAMIFPMASAAAVAVPAPMLSSMIALHIAMILAMLPPSRIGRVQVAMIAPGIAMVVLVAAAWMIVSVARRDDVGVVVDLLHLAIGSFGAFDTLHPLHPLGTFGAFSSPRRARFIALLVRRILHGVVMFANTLLGYRRHRRDRRKQNSH